MTPNISRVSPRLEPTIPGQSIAGRVSARDSGTTRTTRTKPAITTGTLMRNTQPHQALASIQPPTIGTSGSARKFAAPQTPIARGRSSSSNRTVITDRAMTIMAAPAAPRIARAAIRASDDGANAQAAEAAPKTTRPPSSTARRPYRSPRRPIGSIAAVRARVYEVTNHWSSLSDAWKAPARVGSARLRTVASRPTASRATLMPPSASQRRETRAAPVVETVVVDAAMASAPVMRDSGF